MDIVTYIDSDDNPIMLFADSKPVVVMDLEGAELTVEDIKDGDNCYLHIKKSNGVSLSLILDSAGGKQLSSAMFNIVRVRSGYQTVDVDKFMQNVIDKYNRGEEI